MTGAIRMFLLCVGACAVLAGPYAVVRLGGGAAEVSAELSNEFTSAVETVALAESFTADIWERAAVATAGLPANDDAALVADARRLAALTGADALVALTGEFAALSAAGDRSGQEAASPKEPAAEPSGQGTRHRVLDQLSVVDDALLEYRAALVHQLDNSVPNMITVTNVQSGMREVTSMLLAHRQLAGQVIAAMLPDAPDGVAESLPEALAAYEKKTTASIEKGLSYKPTERQRKALQQSAAAMDALFELLDDGVKNLAGSAPSPPKDIATPMHAKAEALAVAVDAAVSEDRELLSRGVQLSGGAGAAGGLVVDVVFAMAAILLVVLMALGSAGSPRRND